MAEKTYGRGGDEWYALKRAALSFLIERAKQGRSTSYTELNEVLWNRTGLRRFDFSRADERAAMGYLLGSIVDDTFPRTKLMISAIVLYLNENDAGTGFYALAQELGLLPRGATQQRKFDFWSSHVTAVYEHYRSR
jgi:hypothetical protein